MEMEHITLPCTCISDNPSKISVIKGDLGIFKLKVDFDKNFEIDVFFNQHSRFSERLHLYGNDKLFLIPIYVIIGVCLSQNIFEKQYNFMSFRVYMDTV